MTVQNVSSQRLSGRVSIVTGASAGIGRAISLALAEAGATIIMVARSRDKLDQLSGEITATGGTARPVVADVSIEADVERVFEVCGEEFGRVDLLVNNAGNTTRFPTDELSLSDWQRVLDVNVTGVFLCSRAALRMMKPRRSGRIINIGSVAAKAPRQDAIAYSTSKAALEGLTRSLAVDGRDHGITASIVQPGNTRSELWTPQRGPLADKEGIMDATELARVVVLVASMPDDINMYEAIVHPIRMPWMGRG